MNILTQLLVILLLSIVCHVLTKLYAGDLLDKFCEWKKFQNFIIWYMKKFKNYDVKVGFNGHGFSMWLQTYKNNSPLPDTKDNWYVKTIIDKKYFQ